MPLVQGKSKLRWAWSCPDCDRECVPVRSESRCLCGHRLREHAEPENEDSCSCTRCPCKRFFYIVAEGSWILRCRCKHKHTEHDPITHACTKAKCQCSVFHSPWVCNCDHPWGCHKQHLVVRESLTFVADATADATADAQLQEALADLKLGPGVNDFDAIKRGEPADEDTAT